jgi:DNA-directed RNA polymerase specialized sigma subunit
MATSTAKMQRNKHANTEAELLREHVVMEHFPLAPGIALREHGNLPVHVDLDDLIHAGVLGLFDAASKHDPRKSLAFSSCAKHGSKASFSIASASSIGPRATSADARSRKKPPPTSSA